MSGDRLNADVENYRRAAALNSPPPQIVPDPLVAGITPVEQLLRVLGIAANLGDPQDNAESVQQHAERGATTMAAAEKFTAQDEEAAAELGAIDGGPYFDGEATTAQPEQAAALAQQLPQMAAGIAGALAGALGGALQPLAQMPQQAAQGMQQAAQTGIGLLRQAADVGATPIEDSALAEAPLTEDLSAVAEDLDGMGATGGGGGELGADPGVGGGGIGSAGGGTAPTAYLGPPPVPSAGTAPASVPFTPASRPATQPAGPTGTAGMAGMPMVPPGAMNGTSNTDRDPKADTKRLSVPAVRNGAAVQGRLTVPPALPRVIKKTDGKPVVARRILAPADNQSSDAKSD